MRAKKSLGQNFLNNTTVVDKMIQALDVQKEDNLVEIGPGKGFLTQQLVTTPAKIVTAIEMDGRMIELLEEKFRESIEKGSFSLIHQDILEWKPENKDKYKIIGNIPFYITGAIIKHILDSEHPPTEMVLLMQKEVAERIIMRDGKNSILGTAVSIYCKPRIVCTVKPGSFNPPPKVHSAVIHFKQITQPFANKEDREGFFVFLKQVFAGKRKMLTTNLKLFFEIDQIKSVLEQEGHIETIRAEDMSPQEILTLWSKLKNPQ